MRVRFVGGPRHNQLGEVGDNPNPTYYIAVPPANDPALLSPDSMWSREAYFLHRFRTSYGTKYVQYIHESLIAKNGKPDTSVYKERFKKWNLAAK